ncbi:BolA family protein [Chromatocurvus halotolerans]|uniref:Acid stress-induced BolA-like protein IbaG/YrbA n=1 Tax=Chromatocurvus halotolerans TaxID=1132028 RepID=A0A4R2KTQ1_9GAMM|nr:BolA/IbaG family iron-sulfur metabolism protein [Chromatocurvus halotolerans]TCO76222.1 acid stress-induced BolA-like protein IbaG/YrbA [Chromatocurvus halotolerans]
MDAKTVEALIKAQLDGCDVSVEGAGSNYDITVIGDVFAGKRPVQRQQMVYAALNERIAAGEIHAVNIRTLTPDQA